MTTTAQLAADILAALAKKPQTADDLAHALDEPRAVVRTILADLYHHAHAVTCAVDGTYSPAAR